MACGILVPRPGIEPGHPAVEAWSPNHWTAREVPTSIQYFYPIYSPYSNFVNCHNNVLSSNFFPWFKILSRITFPIYLSYFFFVLAASSLSCSTRDLRWGMRDLSLWSGLFVVARGLLSSCGVRVFSLLLWHPGSRACGLCSCSTRALLLRCESSVVVAHGLSCPAACGILLPRPGKWWL